MEQGTEAASGAASVMVGAFKAAPGVAVSGLTWLRFSYLPRSPGAQSDGAHMSIERRF
jgi:hypothetical protein